MSRRDGRGGVCWGYRPVLYPNYEGYHKCIHVSKYLELDILRVSSTAQWKLSTQGKFLAWVSGSTRVERGWTVVSQALLASKSKDIITTLWPLKPASLVPEVSSCGAVAATWSGDCRVTSRETGKSWKICPCKLCKYQQC